MTHAWKNRSHVHVDQRQGEDEDVQKGDSGRVMDSKKSPDGEYRRWKIWELEDFLDGEHIVKFKAKRLKMV